MSLVRRDAARGDFFLRDHRHTGRGARQRCEDDQLGGAVGFRHRRSVALGFNLEAAAHDLEDRFARLARRLGQLVEEARVIDHQRGAIRIPPSSRTAAAFM